MPLRLADKVAIVSGGARGLGEAISRVFVREGASVVIADVQDDLGLRLADELGEAAVFQHADVSSEAEWPRCIERAEELGPLTVLVNNAAILRVAPLAETTLDDYMHVIGVNQIGTFLGMRAAIPAMSRAGGGSIVNISSIDGIGSKNGLVAYSASKGAVRSMTKTAALELGHLGIRVNSVHPGGMFTPMMGSTSRAAFDSLHRGLPLGRSGEPEEIAAMVLYLASDEASYSTGGEFVVDGGWLAGDINPLLPGAPART